jgi:nitrogen fixation/metabolism regulation signal transduction histidine kinase
MVTSPRRSDALKAPLWHDRYVVAWSVKILRKIASVADEIADGNLSVHIDVHSEKDVFGKALEKMVKSLNSRIKEARKLAAIVEYSEDGRVAPSGLNCLR